MIIYSRIRNADPTKLTEASTLAAEAASHVSKLTGHEISAWTAMFGRPTNQFSWSVRLDSMTVLADSTGKLQSDASYLKLLEKFNTVFHGPTEDAVFDVVAAAGTPKIGAYVSLTGAEIAGGNMAAAIAWSVDMTHFGAKTADVAMTLVTSRFGPWGQIGWIASADSPAQVDAAEAAMRSEASYLERLDAAGSYFRPGSASRTLLRKIA